MTDQNKTHGVLTEALRKEFIRRTSYISEADRDMRVAFIDEIAAAAVAPAASATAIRLDHVAYCDEGKLQWMSGRKPVDCELYAMPDRGRAPAVVYTAPQSPVAPAECSASGRGPGYGNFGPDGALQCEYCGEAPVAPAEFTGPANAGMDEWMGGKVAPADERAAFAQHITGRDDLKPHEIESVVDYNSSRWLTWQVARARVADAPTVSATANEHTDDDAVDRFAEALKEKLAQARAKGRSGWHECDPRDLSTMLREHVEKGDPRDVANFCMFLWSLGQPINAAPTPPTSAADAADAARYRWLRSREGSNNRLPHITQYPYAPNIDKEKYPQIWDGIKYNPENLDAAIDTAIANSKESGDE